MASPVLIFVKFKTEETAALVADALSELCEAILKDIDTSKGHTERGAANDGTVGATHPLMKKFGDDHGFEWPDDDGFLWTSLEEGTAGKFKLHITEMNRLLFVHHHAALRVGEKGMLTFCRQHGAEEITGAGEAMYLRVSPDDEESEQRLAEAVEEMKAGDSRIVTALPRHRRLLSTEVVVELKLKGGSTFLEFDTRTVGGVNGLAEWLQDAALDYGAIELVASDSVNLDSYLGADVVDSA